MLATGNLSKSAGVPKWLETTTDFVVTGLKSGSTVFELSAPKLRDTARLQFGNVGLFSPNVDINLDDSAIDLMCSAVREALDETSEGNRFDNQFLDSVLRFGHVGRDRDIQCSIAPIDDEHNPTILNDYVLDQLRERKSKLPRPRTHIVTGVLDEIKHSNSHFQLTIGRDRVVGYLRQDTVDTESLRHFWGHKVTVVGIAHFRANGKPRLVEAHQISAHGKGAKYFEEVPSPLHDDKYKSRELERLRSLPRFDPRELSKLWPGDESISVLLNQLKEL